MIPPIPTEPVSPNPMARPCSPAAVEYSAAVRPVSAHAVRAVDVDVERLHVAQVEDDAAVGHAVAGAAVAAAADGELEAGLARERDDASRRRVASATRTITAGRRSMPPMKTVRASS